jgi:hypothetical protein
MGSPKTIYKYTHNGEVGYMHYVELEGKEVALSVLDSLKVKYIQENGTLKVTTDLKDVNYIDVKCKIETDKDFVQKVYDFMLESNNSYFKNGADGLCAIIFKK